MSKPIKFTDALKAQVIEEFSKKLGEITMCDGKLSYTKTFKWEDDENSRAVIVFTPTAFAKMTMLVQTYTTEVAWHSVCTRAKTKGKETFYIKDVLVYPQVVTGGTVNTDQNEYQTWLYGLEDDVFNNLRCQGHSHVNFATSPSTVDTTHQEKLLAQVDDDTLEDRFYVFMIWNKRFEHTIRIFDIENNTLYENEDIDVLIGENGVDLAKFLVDAKPMVKDKPVAPASPIGFTGGTIWKQEGEKKEPPKDDKKEKATTPKIKSTLDEDYSYFSGDEYYSRLYGNFGSGR